MKLAAKFRKMGKSPVLVVNKIDEPENNYSSSEFGKLGFEHVVLVSAEHDHGIDVLSRLLLKLLPDLPPLREGDRDSCKDRVYRASQCGEIFFM